MSGYHSEVHVSVWIWMKLPWWYCKVHHLLASVSASSVKWNFCRVKRHSNIFISRWHCPRIQNLWNFDVTRILEMINLERLQDEKWRCFTAIIMLKPRCPDFKLHLTSVHLNCWDPAAAQKCGSCKWMCFWFCNGQWINAFSPEQFHSVAIECGHVRLSATTTGSSYKGVKNEWLIFTSMTKAVLIQL